MGPGDDIVGARDGSRERVARDRGRRYTAGMAPEDTCPEAERLRAAAQLHELGMAIKRQNLRRQHAGADEAEIERLLGAWLQERRLDSPGRTGTWPRAFR
jgi:hypothetical protein